MLFAALLEEAKDVHVIGPACWTILGVLGGVVTAMALFIVKMLNKLGKLYKEIAKIHEERARYLEEQIRLIQMLKQEMGPGK